MSSIANTSVSGSLKLKGGISLGKKKKKSKKKKRKRDAEKTSDVSSSTTSSTDDAKRAKTTAPIKDTRTASEKSMDAIVRRKVSLFQSTWCRFFNSFGCVSFVYGLHFFFSTSFHARTRLPTPIHTSSLRYNTTISPTYNLTPRLRHNTITRDRRKVISKKMALQDIVIN